MQPHNDPQSPDARWVPLADAARAWDKSENTVRNWIRQGRIVGEQIPRDPDNPRDNRPVWRVLIRDQPQPSADDSESSQSQPILSDPQPPVPDTRDSIILAQMDALADLHERLLDTYQQIVEARERAATAEADAKHAQASATDLAGQLADLRKLHADCSNLSHAEASRIVQEATEQRFRADDLARQFAESQANAARERLESQSALDRERAAREAAEQERDRRWKWRFWER